MMTRYVSGTNLVLALELFPNKRGANGSLEVHHHGPLIKVEIVKEAGSVLHI